CTGPNKLPDGQPGHIRHERQRQRPDAADLQRVRRVAACLVAGRHGDRLHAQKRMGRHGGHLRHGHRRRTEEEAAPLQHCQRQSRLAAPAAATAANATAAIPTSRNLDRQGEPNAGRPDVSMDMNKMMQQVQQLQAQMAQAQEELKNETVEASAGGGMVTVKATGDLQITEIKIAPEAIDPDDPELLSDMVLAAVNEALRSAQALAQSKLGGMAGLGDLGGMGLPGL